MRPILLVALLAAPLCALPRFARVGEFSGAPSVEVHPADGFRTAIRNLPLVEGSRIRSSAGERIEIELDEGAILRLTGDSLAELSDYSSLSTGQRITRLAVDRGTAYLTGEPSGKDILVIVVPGAQVALLAGSRLRLEVADSASTISILEGAVRFMASNVEIDLHRGQGARMAGEFSLLTTIPALESDAWSDHRDKLTAHPASAAYTAAQAGVSDLDQAGGWVRAGEAGMVWKPRVDADWVPFRSGQWEWYGELGFTWIAKEPWGWLPAHYGRWVQDAALGWVWSPDQRPAPAFQPGPVYWMRGNGRIAWGPLGPGETWSGAGRPVFYAPANTTTAVFAAGQKSVEPESTPSPLTGMAFTLAPFSPAFAADRLEISELPMRATTSALPLATSALQPQFTPEPEPPPVPPAPATAKAEPPALPQPLADAGNPEPEYAAPPPTPDTIYPVPTYLGIVVIDPPDDPAKNSHRTAPPRSIARTQPDAPQPPAVTPNPPQLGRPPAPPAPVTEPEHPRPHDRPLDERRDDKAADTVKIAK